MHQRSVPEIHDALQHAVDEDNWFILAQLCRDELRESNRFEPFFEARLQYNLALALLRRCDRIGNQEAAAPLERALQLFTERDNHEGRARTLLLLTQLNLRQKTENLNTSAQLERVYCYCSENGLTYPAVVAAIQLMLVHDPEKELEAYLKARQLLRQFITRSWLAFKFWSGLLRVHPEDLTDLKRNFF